MVVVLGGCARGVAQPAYAEGHHGGLGLDVGDEVGELGGREVELDRGARAGT